MRNDDVLDLAARLRLSTARLARMLRRQAGTGLSPSQQSALAAVELHGPLTLGQLAKHEQVAPPTITRIVSRLEEDGLVARRVDDKDRRIVYVKTTAEGRRRLEHSRKRRNAWLAERLRELDADQLRDVGKALAVLEALTASPESEPDAAADEDDVTASAATPAATGATPKSRR